MGLKIYSVILGAVVIAGFSLIIYFGLQPKPVAKINFSSFETTDILADSVLMRLRQEIMDNSILFLGVDSNYPEHLQIWQNFLGKNQDPKMKYPVVVVDKFLSNANFTEFETLDTKESVSELLSGFQAALSKGQRVAVLVPTLYGAQIIKGNLINRILDRWKELPSPWPQPMSISLVNFPRNREQEKDMRPRCMTNVADESGEGALGCLVVGAARNNYRKHKTPGQKVGLLQQIGLKDYLLFYTEEPAQ
jgi:hypothetical protein